MIFSFMSQYPVTFVLATAFLVNIPLGFFREGAAKFSTKWLLWIHASIPLLIYLRIKLGVSGWIIPLSIAMAVFGQIVGGRRRLKHMSLEERENLQQISNLRLAKEEKAHVEESDCMVVLLNMGGPRDNEEVRPFLQRLFSDSILIRFPLSFLLQPLFAGLLVTFRGEDAKKRYHMIGGGSPIFNATFNQTEALKAELNRRGRNLDCIFSFNYSSPFPDETISEVRRSGKKYILPLSLYPHYSKATTGSNLHYLKKNAKKIFPEVKFLKTPEYYLSPHYISAFVDRIREQLKPDESLDDFYLLFSAHGLPLYFLTEGDPYPFEVAQTVSKITEQLNRKHDWTISYQSAVGPLQWLKPSTEDLIAGLARRGIKKLLIVPISFVTDHIETSCEIDIEYRALAEELGIKDFRMSKALECHPGFIQALADAVEDVIPRKPHSAHEKQKHEIASTTSMR